jgi:integrase
MLATQPKKRRPRRKEWDDAEVTKLKRRARRYFEPDPQMPGHGIRVMPEGPAVFYVIARDAFGKQRWVRIGSTVEKTVEESREKARAIIKRLKEGLAPFEPPPVKRDTVADVAATWLARHVEKKGMRTADEMRRVLDRYVLPHWRDRVFAEIRRSDIANLLDHVEDEHGAWVADSTLAMLRAVASWYATRNDDYVPPFVKGMKRVPSHARQRDRVLSDDELRAVWKTAEADTGPFAALVRVLLLSAQRREKVATMRWEDVSADGTWTIPTEAREKGNATVLRLPPQAMAIISAQPRFVSSPYVFGRADGKPMTGFSPRHAAFVKACGVSGWTLHDLRRTARSLMSRAKVAGEIAERVLGHARRGVEGVYDRHAYDEEKADALRRLAALIETIVRPPSDNVVPIMRQPAAVP